MTDTTITVLRATPVPEEQRMAFLPALFGQRLMLIGERTVFDFMGWLSPNDYGGGLWTFFEFEGKPLFLAPDTDTRFQISCDGNGYRGVLSAEAAGIIATLFAMSHLSLRHESEHLSDGYARLYAYAGAHPEAGEIFQAID
ncbi:antirestriction protein [Pseudorhodobacter sp.]|uniref:antirestriction protein n=1 Tax=Pseudorhodobacter sp. TaxID=1934400 RepID=UPI00264A3C82|nr:antirestriction protein [Pseudorhodobacter sp.]MDN5788650.1 antirestriction protein [Pseudorhodobacter sp.]